MTPRVNKAVKAWGDVFWLWIHKGYPREEAAHRADEWERRLKARGIK